MEESDTTHLRYATSRTIYSLNGTTNTYSVSDEQIQQQCIHLGIINTIHRQRLADMYPKLAALVLDEDSLTLAVNEEYITQRLRLKAGDTVALIPPISGG